jgi:hypothetical protein
MMQVLIYSPARTAGQQGLGKTLDKAGKQPAWKLEFSTEQKYGSLWCPRKPTLAFHALGCWPRAAEKGKGNEEGPSLCAGGKIP